jgi:hypothetical protein
MSYRALLQSTVETVQDQTRSAELRLDEAVTLYLDGKYHSAIYMAGLAAEMFLKTACFFVSGAKNADPIRLLVGAVNRKAHKSARYKSGHSLLFWYEELLARRRRARLGISNDLKQIVSSLSSDWFNEMRYRPGRRPDPEPSDPDALDFLEHVEWLGKNYNALRS